MSIAVTANGDRYRVCKLDGFISGWAVEDLAYLPARLINDFRKGHKSTRPWKGTQDAADDLARLLNERGPDHDRITKVEMSPKERAKRRNMGVGVRRTSVPRESVSALLNQFKKCHCGAMYKGERHCE